MIMFSVKFMMISFPTAAPVSDVDAVIDEDEKCSNAVDIAFLVDSSHTVRDDWSKELLFVQRIANRFLPYILS